MLTSGSLLLISFADILSFCLLLSRIGFCLIIYASYAVLFNFCTVMDFFHFYIPTESTDLVKLPTCRTFSKGGLQV